MIAGIFILLPVILLSYNYFSPLGRLELIDLSSSRKIELQEKPLIKNSVTVTTAGDTLLQDIDYELDHINGVLEFSENYGIVKIEYSVYPENLRNEFFNFKPVTDIVRDTTIIKKRKLSNSRYQDLNLKVSGNKTISISVADDEDFQLDQSLYLQINGELSENVNIQAQVTDSQSPLTPEGNSRELSNLDRIFIRIYGKQYELGFGDLEYDFRKSYYLNFNPVFEGLQASWKKTANAGIGLTKSESKNLEIAAIEGRQGPYWLENSYSGDAVIVAGSEKIYLNGLELSRGDDYTIDYAEGSITFTERHFISSSDEIYAVYQYSDEEFRQTVYLADTSIELSDAAGFASGIYYLEDDADNPLSTEYSASDLDSLQAAGDNSAWGNGIYETEEGAGEYIYNPLGFFQYVGIDSTGTFNLSFYETEDGDYTLSPQGYYQYVGEGMGDYLPGVSLALPQKQANYYLNGYYRKGEFDLKSEILYSYYDMNTKSSLDDNDNQGWAANTSINWKKNSDVFQPYAGLYAEYLSENLFTFTPVDSAEDLLENSVITDTLAKTEISFTTGFDYRNIFKPNVILKRQKAGENKLDFLKSHSVIEQFRIFPEIDYSIVKWKKIQSDTTDYEKQQISIIYNISGFEAGYKYMIKEDNSAGFYKFKQKTSYLQYDKNDLFTKAYWQKNDTDSLNTISENSSETTGIQLELNKKSQTLIINLAHRTIENENDYDIGEIDYRGRFFKLLSLNSNYSLRNLDFYPRIKELIYIGDGEGSYNEDGEEDEDGDYDWQVTSIDYSSPQPSIELNADAGMRLEPPTDFPRFIQKMRVTFDGSLTEQSTTKQHGKLYLLQSSELMQPDKTIYGRQYFRTNLWYNLLDRIIDIRLTAEAEDRLDNRYQEGEKYQRDNQEFYLRYKYSRKLGFELLLEKMNENDSRYHLNSKTQDISVEVKYTAKNSMNYSCRVAFGDEYNNDDVNDYKYELNKYEIIPSMNWYPKKGSRLYLRLNYRHNDSKGDEYTTWQEENREGDVFKGSISYVHQVSRYITYSAEYQLEKFPLEKIHNEIKMQVSAEF